MESKNGRFPLSQLGKGEVAKEVAVYAMDVKDIGIQINWILCNFIGAYTVDVI
jgi:hypothetical protein